MQVEAQAGDGLTADVVVVPVAEGGDPPGGANERVRELVASGEAGTDFGASRCTVVDGQRIAVAGLGRRADADAVRTAVAGAARRARRVGGTLAYVVDDSLAVDADGAGARGRGRARPRHLRHAQVALAGRHRKKPFDRLVLVGGDDGATAAAERAARVASWANRARDLVERAAERAHAGAARRARVGARARRRARSSRSTGSRSSS